MGCQSTYQLRCYPYTLGEILPFHIRRASRSPTVHHSWCYEPPQALVVLLDRIIVVPWFESLSKSSVKTRHFPAWSSTMGPMTNPTNLSTHSYPEYQMTFPSHFHASSWDRLMSPSMIGWWIIPFPHRAALGETTSFVINDRNIVRISGLLFRPIQYIWRASQSLARMYRFNWWSI